MILKPIILEYDNDLVKKALVSMAIEKTLLGIGKETYDKVAHELYKRHHSYFQDCYKHPEYLSEILKQVYDDSHEVIAESIKKQIIGEFFDYEPIERFLEVISK